MLVYSASSHGGGGIITPFRSPMWLSATHLLGPHCCLPGSALGKWSQELSQVWNPGTPVYNVHFPADFLTTRPNSCHFHFYYEKLQTFPKLRENIVMNTLYVSLNSVTFVNCLVKGHV